MSESAPMLGISGIIEIHAGYLSLLLISAFWYCYVMTRWDSVSR